MAGRPALQLDGVGRGATLFLNLSGGIDSTYQAYRLLESGRNLLIHHCHYKTAQQRWPHEADSVDAVLDWFVTKGWQEQFRYIETTFDRGTALEFRFPDIRFLNPLTGLLLADPERADVKFVVSGHHQNSPDPYRPNAVKYRRTADMLSGRKLRWVFPTLHMTKAQIIRDTPPELFDRTWWCREPDNGLPCRACHTCVQVFEVIGDSWLSSASTLKVSEN